jgi:hypothetical protein
MKWILLPASSLFVSLPVDVTYYTSSPRETDSTPYIAACGRVGTGSIAVSEDIWRLVRCGDIVLLDGVPYVVWDRMHGRWRRRVDVWVPSRGVALRSGRRRGVVTLTFCDMGRCPNFVNVVWAVERSCRNGHSCRGLLRGL